MKTIISLIKVKGIRVKSDSGLEKRLYRVNLARIWRKGICGRFRIKG
jgi:hypothetical protein